MEETRDKNIDRGSSAVLAWRPKAPEQIRVEKRKGELHVHDVDDSENKPPHDLSPPCRGRWKEDEPDGSHANRQNHHGKVNGRLNVWRQNA